MGVDMCHIYDDGKDQGHQLRLVRFEFLNLAQEHHPIQTELFAVFKQVVPMAGGDANLIYRKVVSVNLGDRSRMGVVIGSSVLSFLFANVYVPTM